MSTLQESDCVVNRIYTNYMDDSSWQTFCRKVLLKADQSFYFEF